MGFTFGYVIQIDSKVALGSFVMMIAFLVGFDHLTGGLEWALEGVPIYNHMLQHIYKEIMIMGVVSFCIGMYNTSEEAHRLENQEWIIGVDFAHYVLFYMAFFFVLHAFYLIFLAMATARAFDKYQSMPISEVRRLVPLDYGWLNTAIFNYSPVSKVREKFEFKIVHVLFRDTYKWVTLDFNFAGYLTGCMQHYALKVMSAGSFSWLVILVLIVLNYARIQLGGDGYLNCGAGKFAIPHGAYNGTDDDHHRLLEAADGEYSSPEESSRVLISGGATTYDVTEECSIKVLRAFFMCGMALCTVTLIFLGVSRLYLARLIERTGCQSPKDYSNFLAIEEDTLAAEARECRRRAASDGSASIQAEADSNSFRLAEIRQMRLSGNSGGRRLSVSGGGGGGKQSQSRRLSIGTAARSINALKKKAVSEEEEMYMRLSNCVSACRLSLKHGFGRIVDWFEDWWMYLFRREAYNRMLEKRKGGASSVLKRRVAPDGSTLSPSPSVERQRSGERLEKSGGLPAPGAGPGDGARRSVFKPRATVFPLAVEESNSTITKFRMQKLSSGSAISGVSPRGLARSGRVRPHGHGHGPADAAADAAAEDPDAAGINSSQDFSDIYFLQRPELFFTSIEVLFSLNCFYLAMWCTNFITIVEETLQYKIYWQIMMLFPVLLIMPCLGQIVKSASLLTAISELDLNVMAKVFEDTQDRMNLLQVLRERIKERIDDTDERNNTPELVVANLFAEIDTDDSGELSKKEFSLFFTLLDLNYSDDKFNHLYHTIDINKDGSISKQELCQMVFPELNADVVERATDLIRTSGEREEDRMASVKGQLCESGLVRDAEDPRRMSKRSGAGVGLLVPPADPVGTEPLRRSFTQRLDAAPEEDPPSDGDGDGDDERGAKHAVREPSVVAPAPDSAARRGSMDDVEDILEELL